ncbi:MAG: PAS domain S-box protein, partial [bacterium]
LERERERADALAERVSQLEGDQSMARLIQTEEALRRSEEKFRRLFETVPDALYLIDQETGRILDANPAAVRMYGYGSEEWLGLHQSDVAAGPEDLPAIDEHPPRNALRYHRRKDGAVFPVEMSMGYFAQNGKLLIIVTCRDISRRLEAEQKLDSVLEAAGSDC